MNAHAREVKRVGDLLYNDAPLMGLGDLRANGREDVYKLVAYVLDQYHPRIEWKDIPAESQKEYDSDPAERKWAYFARREARVRLGSLMIAFRYMISPHMRREEIDGALKRHMMVKLGVALASWMDGGEIGEPICTCGRGEAEDDRSAVLRCPLHGPQQ